MTTIFCSRDFLLADCRSTTCVENRHHLFKDAKIRRDDTIKIRDLRDVNLYLDGKRVEVFCFSGSVAFANQLHAAMKFAYVQMKKSSKTKNPQLQLLEVLAFARSLCTEDKRSLKSIATLFFLLEGTGLLKVYLHPDRETDGTDVKSCRYWIDGDHQDKNTEIVAVGSGYEYFKDFEKFINPKADVLSMFLFACHLDPNSSSSFTLYDRKEKTITTYDYDSEQLLQKISGVVEGMPQRIIDYKKNQLIYVPEEKEFMGEIYFKEHEKEKTPESENPPQAPAAE